MPRATHLYVAVSFSLRETQNVAAGFGTLRPRGAEFQDLTENFCNSDKIRVFFNIGCSERDHISHSKRAERKEGVEAYF